LVQEIGTLSITWCPFSKCACAFLLLAEIFYLCEANWHLNLSLHQQHINTNILVVCPVQCERNLSMLWKNQLPPRSAKLQEEYEDEGSRFLRNIRKFPSNHTMSHYRKRHSWNSPSQEPQTSQENAYCNSIRLFTKQNTRNVKLNKSVNGLDYIASVVAEWNLSMDRR
jgi:hypothetical protein